MKRNRSIPLIVAVVVLIAIVVAVGQGNQSNADAFLEKYGLQGLDTKEIVYRLDSSVDESADLQASITGEQLTLSDSESTINIDLPKDSFYLSFAPYLETTHPCAFHSLSSCRGELVNKAVHVTIAESNGNVLVDSDLTTMANGFIGVWLPRDVDATVQVDYSGKTAESAISTFADSDTCLTTPLKLN
ncbi:MAG: CueP family metal-binding protein [Anaerolineaceae bacterium]